MSSQIQKILKKPLIVHEIDSVPLHIVNIPIALKQKYRYLRYILPPKSDIAEIKCFTEKSGKRIALHGKNSIETTPQIKEKYLNKIGYINAFDNNWASFYLWNNRYRPKWLSIDFGQKKDIRQISFAPRSDTNFIIPGNEYELFFWNADICYWQTLGKKQANSHILNYDNVPKQSLLWLRCLTEGVEERIFTYENNKQVWW